MSFLTTCIFQKMSRPKRTCTLPQAAPVFSEVAQQALNSTPDQVRTLFQKVTTHFRQDSDALSAFWFSDTGLYDLQVPQHIQLMSLILDTVSCKDPRAKAFLDTLLTDTVSELGFVRAMRNGAFYYRNRNGDRTDRH